MIEQAMSIIDDYLNAGDKEARALVSVKAKELYKQYYGKEYSNRIHSRLMKDSTGKIFNDGAITIKNWTNKKKFKAKEGVFYCHYCQCQLAFEELTADHVIPRSKGGTNNIENLVPSCKKCNLKKGAKNYDEFLKEINF